ncbi:putative nepenthesin [Helianthus annuus]|nr:putative nepenthesin [Helianthus annuus]KAJ0896953.1 putative nepenthesin [Helianthus annuus]KAJ0900823.1 putative nepenthesin [Helianthus annuus]
MHASFILTPSQLSFMAPSIFHILLLILFHLLLATAPTSSARTPTRRKQTGFRAPLTRVKNPLEASLVTSRMTASKDEYLLSLAVGTPPKPFSAIMDTGSDLIWTKCKSSNDPGSFDPSKSISFVEINETCEMLGLSADCIQKYADGHSVSVTLAADALTVPGTGQNMHGGIFGCGIPDDENFMYDGVVGMGRGVLSLVTLSNQTIFSYCLGSRFDPETSSVLLTGSEASNYYDSDVQTTPLVTDASNYIITLEGISVGETKLAVTKNDFVTSDGGMVVDSGTTFMYLDARIIEMISNEFVNQTKLEKYTGYAKPYYTGLEHCFNAPGNVQIPNLVFHFEGADWELPKENYIYQQQGNDMACLAFVADDKQFIFGNMQQQNMMVIYDLYNNNLSFKPANCKLL